MLFTHSCVLFFSYMILYDIPIVTGARSLSRNYVYAPHGQSMGFSHDFIYGPFRGPCPLFSCYVPPSDCTAL